jgi:uncharacterized protein
MKLLWLFMVLALVAEFLGTVGGFGSSVFFVPFAGYFLDFHSVLGITAVFHLASNLSKIALFRKGLDWSLILRIGVPGIAFVLLGSLLSQWMPKAEASLVLGCFLVLFSGMLLFYGKVNIRPSLGNSIVGGGLSGLFAGLLGTGGAIRGMTLAAFNLEKEVFIATSAVIDMGIDLSRTVVYVAEGYVHRHDLYLIPILVVLSFVGTLLGKKMLNYISQAQFRNVVLFLILSIGLLSLGQYIWGWSLL